MTTVAQVPQKTMVRHDIPIYLMLTGVVATIALAADFLNGTVRLGYVGVREVHTVEMALAALVAGLILDLAFGQRFTLEWLNDMLTSRKQLAKFVAISVELALLTLLVREFQIGNEAFYQTTAIIVFLGFLIHSLLPLRYRLLFFLLLSLLTIQAIFGWTAGTWLVAIGIVLICICHLPIPFAARTTLILAAGVLLALLRVDRVIHLPSLGVIWPILGSMFMFRLIVYLYDIQHDKAPLSIPASLSYFFLLPNVVFPLFPVIDYKTFRRTYYDSDQQRIYQRGIEWIFRGVFQLILYRYVYSHLAISASEVVGVFTLTRYIVANFALYLRVSGLFHLVIGILHLFGFHLPETHHRYFLSSSFTDFWRRINIYWKDFMMKLFFYPSYFRFKKWGSTTALVLSTLLVFTCTWLLHSYQWFWLRGTFPLRSVDMIFWGVLALLVVANSLYEAKHGRKRSLGKSEGSIRNLGPLALRTAGTFSLIAVLWSLWTADSVSEWTSIWHAVGTHPSSSLVVLPVIFIAATVSGGVQSVAAKRKIVITSGPAKPAVPSIYRSMAVTGTFIVILLVIGHPSVYSHFGFKAQELIRDSRVEGLNKRDAALLRRGYYEGLMGAERFSSQLWEVNLRRPAYSPDINETEASHKTGDFLSYELRPFAGIVFKGKPFSTNRWGMRDQEHTQDKPLNTYRYALVGASPEMGSGVGDNETMSHFLEMRLNGERANGGSKSKYQVLNFAVGGYTPPQFLWVLEHKVFNFQPDAVLYVAHENDEESSVRHLAKMVRAGVDIPYAPLKDLVRKSGIGRNTPLDVAERQLRPLQWQVLSWIYSQVAKDCREHGVEPIWIFMGDPGLKVPQDATALHFQLAEQAGFTRIDLRDWFNDQDIHAVTVAEWDWHPNAQGQKLIADRLYSALREERSSRLRLDVSR